jgi:hypothetical protein
MAAKGITGEKLKTTGTQVITFRVGSKTKHEFLISPLDVDYSGILGVDILKRMEARVDLRISTSHREDSSPIVRTGGRAVPIN